MPILNPPPAHFNIRFSGIMGTEAAPWEIFVFGLNLIPPAANAEATPAARSALAAACRQAFAGGLHQTISSECKLTRTRVADIGPAGLVRRDFFGAYAQNDDETVVPCTGSPGKAPQVALAVSTVTQFAGRTGRGRFYLPLPDYAPLEQGLLPEVTRQAVLTRAVTFLNAINTAAVANGFGRLCIASGGSVTTNQPPALIPITAVRVGRVLDTMRSRRSALNEAYVQTALN
jgi:hypothetical protein